MRTDYICDVFWSKVNEDGPIPGHRPELGPCWEWTRCLANGYGHLRLGGRDRSAHRVSWELAHGIIPARLCVLHRCDNRACVRPDHLFLGTKRDNTRDMLTKGRHVVASGHHNGRYTHPERNARGERSASAKLTADMVRDIRQRYAAGGVTQRALAAEVGVVHTTIGAILRRRKWAHVE